MRWPSSKAGKPQCSSRPDVALITRLLCALFGHRWTVAPGDHLSDVGAEKNCECGAHWPAVVWPQGAGYQPLASESIDKPRPTRPAPAMPMCAPPKPQESIERELASLRARVGKLERLAKE